MLRWLARITVILSPILFTFNPTGTAHASMNMSLANAVSAAQQTQTSTQNVLEADRLKSIVITTVHRHTISKRTEALRWARTQKGKPYVWGGTGPGGYDCSGLMVAAYAHVGIHLPRTTYDMLASSMLVPSTHPLSGYLAFFGSGHVEMASHPKYHYTIGARMPGTVVGPHKWSEYFAPTAFYFVRGSNQPWKIVTTTDKERISIYAYAYDRMGIRNVANHKRQYHCLDLLWTKESNWNRFAQNSYSGAYGIPQAVPGSKMASIGPDWPDNAHTQVKWGLNYIRKVYTRPCAAWSHELNYGWY